MMLWAIGTARLRSKPTLQAGVMALLSPGELMEETGRTGTSQGSAGELQWLEVRYRSLTGWVYAPLVEKYVPESGLILTYPDGIQTPDPWDAQQYIIWEGDKKTNLCGELCIVYCSESGNIGTFLPAWKKQSPGNYRIAVTDNKPTGAAVLEDMAKVYDMECRSLERELTDPVAGFLMSPGRLKARLIDGWKLVAGVAISGASGKLNAGRIGHWVVLVDVVSARNGDGLVALYNPFSNRIESYSYAEFSQAMHAFGGLAGLWVKNKPAPLPVEHPPVSKSETGGEG